MLAKVATKLDERKRPKKITIYLIFIILLSFATGSGNIHAEKACDGDVLALNCSGYQYTIKILHATYGSFPHSCGQQLSSQSCPTLDVKSKVVTMCQDSKECDITIKKALFDYSCSNGPENHQLQIFYQCTSTNIRSKYSDEGTSATGELEKNRN